MLRLSGLVVLSALLLGICRAAEPIAIDVLDATAWKGSPAPRRIEHAPPVGTPRPALAFHPGRREPNRWALPRRLDLSAHDTVALRFAADDPAQGTLALRSGQGAYERSFELVPGEQIVLLALGSFHRGKGAAGLEDVPALELGLSSSHRGATIRLLGVEALSGDAPLDPGALLLHHPASRVHRQGVAYPIYAIVDGGAFAQQRTAQTLQGYLARMFGVKLPVNPEGLEIRDGFRNVILLGEAAATRAGALTADDLAPWGFTGFIVDARGPAIAIAGTTRHGTGHGLYRFLEQQGCRFYAPGCERVPTKSPPHLLTCRIADKPFFHAKGCVGSPAIRGWSYELMGDARKMPDADVCDKTLWLDHTAAYLVPKKLYYDRHPEYYALLGNGARLPKDSPDVRVMLCLSNPDVLRISAERMLRWVEHQPDRRVFVVSQGDGAEWCNCERCRHIGNRADQTLHWANYVARAVARKFPDRVLMTNAYNGADEPPLNLKPEKNLVVVYAAWPNASSAPNSLRDFEARENVVARTHLEGWLEAAPHNMGLYDYNGGGRYTLFGMAWRIKWCAKRDMRAVWYCGINQSFRSLFSYVHCRLTWDPWEDVSRLKNEFIQAYYGDAAPAVRELVDLIYDRLEFGTYDARMRAGGHPPPDFYDAAFVDRVFSLFDQALRLAEGNQAAVDDLSTARKTFVGNAFVLCPGRLGQLTDDQYRAFGRNLKEYVHTVWQPSYEERCAKAAKSGKPKPTLDGLATRVWDLTFVDIGKPPAEGKLPTLLEQMIADPKGVVEKHRKTDFVEKLPDGWRVPGIQFIGGQHWRSYGWNCPKRERVIVVRGTMTSVSRMTARLALDAAPPDRDGILEIEGQDSDKEWCAPAVIQLFVNGTKLFEGPNGFAKRGWSRRKWPLAKGLLKKGENTIEIRNLAASDSLVSHWLMLSELLIRYPEP